MTIEMLEGHFGSHPVDRFIFTRRIGERKFFKEGDPSAIPWFLRAPLFMIKANIE